MDTLGILLIVGISLYVAFKILMFLKKKGLLKFNKKDKTAKPKKSEKKAKELNQMNLSGSVRLVDKYMYRREVKALIALNRVLPKEYIALPKVGVANLVAPDGTRNLYNEIKDAFIDFVIFDEETMKPKLIVDVYDNSFEDELLTQKHPELVEVMKDLKVGLVEVAVRGDIDLVLLKQLINKNLGIFEDKKPENTEN